MEPFLGQIIGYGGDNLIAVDYTYPALVVTCSQCGFMVPLNAIKAGVVPPDTASDASAGPTVDVAEGK